MYQGTTSTYTPGQHTVSTPVPPQSQVTNTAEQAFWLRNQRLREQQAAKNLDEAVATINAQTRELHEAAAYNERVNTEMAETKRHIERLQPELHRQLYSPLWNFARANRRGQVVPNNLWLVTSLALLAAGVFMLVM